MGCLLHTPGCKGHAETLCVLIIIVAALDFKSEPIIISPFVWLIKMVGSYVGCNEMNVKVVDVGVRSKIL